MSFALRARAVRAIGIVRDIYRIIGFTDIAETPSFIPSYRSIPPDRRRQVFAKGGSPICRKRIGQYLCSWSVARSTCYDLDCVNDQFKVQLHPESFHSYRCDAPAPEVDVTKDELVKLYTQMVSPISERSNGRSR